MAIGAKAIWEFADALKQSFSTPSDTRAATVQSVDDDGTVWVVYPGASSPTPIASVGAAVEPGDYVYTQLLNGRLVLTTNKTDPASGVKRTRSIVNAVTQPINRAVVIAKGIADEAKAVANAINQHFWTDDNGAHVTDVTQDEWKAAVDDGFSDLSDTKPYYNQLSNSLGILLRSGLNNLASWTRSAIAFFDGNGNEAGNIVASFGRDGAQIGRADSEHVDIGYGSVSMVNADGATMFNADLDGGVVQTRVIYTGESKRMNFPRSFSRSISRASHFSISIPDAIVGTNIEPYSAELSAQFIGSVYLDGTGVSFDLSTAVMGDLSAEISGGILNFYAPTSALTAVVGTDKTVSLTAFNIKWHTNGSTMQVDCNFTYDAETGLLDLMVRVHLYLRTDVSSYTFDAISVYGYLPRYAATVATTAPAFALGTQTGTPGHFSATIGEGLIATQDHQTALGKYNAEDTNDEYALIVGNGTDDANRSNALAVTWDGDIETAKDTAWITLNGVIKYRVHHGVCYVCGDSAGGGTSVGTGGTNVGTLPVGARPSITVTGAASTKSNTANGQYSIDLSGVIKVWNLSTSSPYWCFTAAFPVG